MKRRLFLKTMLTGSTVAIAGVGITWFSIDSDDEPLTIKRSLLKLNKLQQILIEAGNTSTSVITTAGEWDLSQIFNHCAQSVEYSMTGYPEHKSQIFKQTLGSLAFSAFAAKGIMTHNLSETIPGAAVINQHKGLLQQLAALERFKKSLIEFDTFTEPLQPHFAYGELTKKEYAQAHAMHFNNHLTEILI